VKQFVTDDETASASAAAERSNDTASRPADNAESKGKKKKLGRKAKG